MSHVFSNGINYLDCLFYPCRLAWYYMFIESLSLTLSGVFLKTNSSFWPERSSIHGEFTGQKGWGQTSSMSCSVSAEGDILMTQRDCRHKSFWSAVLFSYLSHPGDIRPYIPTDWEICNNHWCIVFVKGWSCDFRVVCT